MAGRQQHYAVHPLQGMWDAHAEQQELRKAQDGLEHEKGGEAMSMSAATEQIMFNEMTRVRKSGKYSPHESNYTRLFGTPERAAQLIADNCEYLDYCGQCWVTVANCDGKYSTVLEWLRGDAE
jgi:hypothetical protein